eukprot:8007490-Ditylum_brightwellii.AAC.1
MDKKNKKEREKTETKKKGQGKKKKEEKIDKVVTSKQVKKPAKSGDASDSTFDEMFSDLHIEQKEKSKTWKKIKNTFWAEIWKRGTSLSSSSIDTKGEKTGHIRKKLKPDVIKKDWDLDYASSSPSPEASVEKKGRQKEDLYKDPYLKYQFLMLGMGLQRRNRSHLALWLLTNQLVLDII